MKHQQQRVAVGAIMAMDPDILIFDEPTTGQDLVSLTKFAGIMEQMYQDENKTCIIVSHDMDFVANHATRMIVVADGRIIADDHPANVFMKPEVMKQANITPPSTARLAQRLNTYGFPQDTIQLQAFCNRLIQDYL